MAGDLRVKFDTHGLGDVVHFAHAVQLWKRRGFDVTVQAEENKLFLWKVAGVNIVQGGDLTNHGYGYPAGFDDLAIPDCDANKVAFGLRDDVMPPLGLSNAEAWDELCAVRLDARPHIGKQAREEAAAFVKGLPKPIICLHTRGTNWHERKSLSEALACDVQKLLLSRFDGSIIILDWDSRAPQIGHARIKGIIPAWGMIDPERLCALYELCDLMIGVDSGPLHVAALTGIPTLGVFHSLHPTRVCLPSPNTTYLVGERYRTPLANRGEAPWRFAFYSGAIPTAEQIVPLAVSILASATSRAETLPITTTVAAQHADVTIAGRYLYRRVGHDERAMELLGDGTVGEGAAGRERTWCVSRTPSGLALTLFGDYGGPTCHLDRHDDGSWSGRWLEYEKMPIQLIPITPDLPKPALHPSDAVPDAEARFYFGILTYNRFDLLERAIEAVLKSTMLPRAIYVVDNSSGKWPGHPSRRVHTIRPPYNLGVARGFNVLQSLCQPHPIIVGADDVEVGPNLCEKMLSCPSPVVFADERSAFTVHLIRAAAWQAIGPWDSEFYPAYHEDNDYTMRMKLAGVTAGCPLSDGFVENGPSATKAAMSAEERKQLDERFDRGRERYLRKWGGIPHQETFTVPFNGASQ